jgi:hypothetical protein
MRNNQLVTGRACRLNNYELEFDWKNRIILINKMQMNKDKGTMNPESGVNSDT